MAGNAARASTPASRSETSRVPTSTAASPRGADPARRSSAPQTAPPAVRLSTAQRTPISAEVPALSGGEPLSADVRRLIERSLGVSLESVRVHTDAAAQKAARDASARAFTVGNHIFLGPGESPTDLALIAHEAAHVVQQALPAAAPRTALPAVQYQANGAVKQQPPAGSAGVSPAHLTGNEHSRRDARAPSRNSISGLQRLGSGESDRYEREAQQVSSAVVGRERFRVSERTAGPHAQRWGISDALDYFADAANNIPGFAMLTFVLGFNPINMRRVERNATNLFRAITGFIPGGNLVFQALQRHGIIDRVGAWVQEQLNTLGMTANLLRQALDRFLDSLSWRDIFNLGGVWDRAKRIFTEPIDRIISFLGGLVMGILRFIRDAILRPVARLAEGTRGYDLLRLVLGQDPITGDPYPRTPENMIGGFMRLIGQEEKWQHLQQSRAIPRAWAWFQQQFGILMGFVREIPQLFIRLWELLQISDLLDIGGAFNRVRNIFGGFVSNFLSWAGNAALQIMMFIFEVLAPGAMPVLRRAASVIRTIIGDPIRFIGNLVRAGVQGFRQFSTNIRTHLINGLVGWLTGALSGAGLQLPQRWDLRGILSLVLQILGLTWQNIRQKLVRHLGERAVAVLETTFEIVVILVREGPAAAWQKILEHLQNLQEMVFGQIRDWVARTVVGQAVIRIASMLNPAGAVIQAIIAIYNTIMFFRERLQQIIQVAEAFFNSIAQIASGAIGAAANYVEQAMARFVPVVISFLARLIGLGGISNTIRNIIDRIRAPIDRALDRVVEWIVTQARRLGRAIVSGVRSAVARVMGWLQLRKEFRTRGARGASHSLFFRGQGRAARLMLASEEPKTVEERIEAAKGKPNADRAKLDTALVKAREIRGVIDAAMGDQTRPDEASARRQEQTVNRALDDLKDILAQCDIDERDIPLTNITFQVTDNKAKMVKAEPLTKHPGNTQGQELPAGGGGERPVGWDYVTEINARSYILEGNGKPKTTSTGRIRLSKPWKRVHVVSHHFHGPARTWNLFPAVEAINSLFKTDVENPLKPKQAAGSELSLEVNLGYPSDTTEIVFREQDTDNELARAKKSDFPNSISVMVGEKLPGSDTFTKQPVRVPPLEPPSTTGLGTNFMVDLYKNRITERLQKAKAPAKPWYLVYPAMIFIDIRERLGADNMKILADFYNAEKVRLNK